MHNNNDIECAVKELATRANKPFNQFVATKHLFSYDIGFTPVECAMFLTLLAAQYEVSLVELYKSATPLTYSAIISAIQRLTDKTVVNWETDL